MFVSIQELFTCLILSGYWFLNALAKSVAIINNIETFHLKGFFLANGFHPISLVSAVPVLKNRDSLMITSKLNSGRHSRLYQDHRGCPLTCTHETSGEQTRLLAPHLWCFAALTTASTCSSILQGCHQATGTALPTSVESEPATVQRGTWKPSPLGTTLKASRIVSFPEALG